MISRGIRSSLSVHLIEILPHAFSQHFLPIGCLSSALPSLLHSRLHRHGWFLRSGKQLLIVDFDIYGVFVVLRHLHYSFIPVFFFV